MEPLLGQASRPIPSHAKRLQTISSSGPCAATWMEFLKYFPDLLRWRSPGNVTGWAILAFMLMNSIPLANSFPWYFLDPSYARTYGFDASSNCVTHPSFTSVRKHGTPVADSGITFQVFNASGKSTSSILCPGSEHILKVSFGNLRLALLNSNPPVVEFTAPSPTANCPNQVILGNSSGGATDFTTRFRVPCSAAGTQLMFKVTSVGGPNYTWKTSNLTVQVAGTDSPDMAAGGICAAASSSCSCARSFLGYDCMTEWRNVTVHWSVNSTMAPSNPCTPATRTELKAADMNKYGSLHMAIQSAATGYVALGFAATAGSMVPSDIIMGWAVDGTNTSVSTFDTSRNKSLFTSNNTANTWAYDRGVSYSASSGITTLCFSRLLLDERARAVPDLRASSNSKLAINFAVSPKDGLTKHLNGSVGGFNIDMSRGAVELAPPPSTLIATAPPPLASHNCTPSTLGYQCMVQRGEVVVHWTVNSAVSPNNTCTPATKTRVEGDELTRVGTLHMAVQSEDRGYVALGFAVNPSDMYPSDIILGLLANSGAATISTFHATRNGITLGDIVSPTWAYDTGLVYDATASLLTLCFSRRLLDDRARVSADLRHVAAGSGSSEAANSRRRLFQKANVNSQLSLIWAVNPTARLIQHSDEDAGGFNLDVGSGGVEEPEDSEDIRYWINVHGALMAVSWGLLLPLGTLLPAHRWLLGSSKVGSKALWFLLHLFFQWTGVALFVAGFVVAYVKFGDVEGESLVEAHRDIGIAIMAAAGAQVVFAFVRPNPEHPRRGLWNLMHHNLGRATVLLAWANVYIGIVVNHMDNEVAYTAWVVPIAIVMGLLVITDLSLRLVGLYRKDSAIPALVDDVGKSPEGVNSGGKGDAGHPTFSQLGEDGNGQVA